ncbi:DUF2971 domain-containing protein [Serratia proteamaculans]|uniref:DUF2971 domain-containing protein n=1 Tax=Serratia proteamaculans TaxID=28151 RepID=UPI0039AF5DAA
MALIYHYCSPQTFLQVIERKCIWLSSTNNMNDFAEGEWFISAVKRMLEIKQDEYGSEWCNTAWVHFISNISPKYITCFSKNSDSLSQWRAYAQDGEGVAIGFEDSAFGAEGDTIHTNISPKKSLCLKDVKYSSAQEIFNELSTTAELFRSLDTEEPSNSALTFSAICSSLAMLTKNPAFEEENERRLVYSALITVRQNDGSVEVMNALGDIRHRVSNGYLTSYFELNFNPVDAIKDIVLGPKNKFHKTDLSNFLGINSLGSVSFRRSAATYR